MVEEGGVELEEGRGQVPPRELPTHDLVRVVHGVLVLRAIADEEAQALFRERCAVAAALQEDVLGAKGGDEGEPVGVLELVEALGEEARELAAAIEASKQVPGVAASLEQLAVSEQSAAAPPTVDLEADCCAICLDETDSARLIQPCGTCNGYMHLACASMWRRQCRSRGKVPTCPCCNMEF